MLKEIKEICHEMIKATRGFFMGKMTKASQKSKQLSMEVLAAEYCLSVETIRKIVYK